MIHRLTAPGPDMLREQAQQASRCFPAILAHCSLPSQALAVGFWGVHYSVSAGACRVFVPHTARFRRAARPRWAARRVEAVQEVRLGDYVRSTVAAPPQHLVLLETHSELPCLFDIVAGPVGAAAVHKTELPLRQLQTKAGRKEGGRPDKREWIEAKCQAARRRAVNFIIPKQV